MIQKTLAKCTIIWFFIELTNCTAFASDSSFVQYRFSLTKNSSIPFSLESEDYCVWGFEVDKKESFWFLGGDSTTLVNVSKNDSVIIKRNYKEFSANPIGIVDDKLYIFETLNNRNELFILSTDSGKIKQKYSQLFKNKVNSLSYRDNGIVFELLFVKPPYDVNEMLKYVLYNYKGKFITGVPDKSGLGNYLQGLRFDYYLGKYKGFPMIVGFDYEKNQFIIAAINSQGRNLYELKIDGNLLGDPFYGAPEEHWCLKGSKLFILMRKKENAVITELDFNKMLN
jgi:hypothetical protein